MRTSGLCVGQFGFREWCGVMKMVVGGMEQSSFLRDSENLLSAPAAGGKASLSVVGLGFEGS